MSKPRSYAANRIARPFVNLPGVKVTATEKDGRISRFDAVVNGKEFSAVVIKDDILSAWLKVETWIYKQ